MPAGRPTKYEFNLREIQTYSFSNERSLNNLLLRDIDFFMETVFNEKVKSATDKKHEYQGFAKLKTGQKLPLRGVRLDLWVECESGAKYIIEIKNPKKGNYDSIAAIGQILGYSMKFPNSKLVIVSTAYDEGFLEIVQKYNLPIDFVLITETQTFLLKK